MRYDLPDGRSIDVGQVADISFVRDLGPDRNAISRSFIGFYIRMKNGESIPVVKHYHFCDWAVAMKELEHIRKEISTLVNDANPK